LILNKEFGIINGGNLNKSLKNNNDGLHIHRPPIMILVEGRGGPKEMLKMV
jgi:hypothetical protein